MAPHLTPHTGHAPAGAGGGASGAGRGRPRRLEEALTWPLASTPRAELRACRERMGLLTKQQESVAADVAAEREANHM